MLKYTTHDQKKRREAINSLEEEEKAEWTEK